MNDNNNNDKLPVVSNHSVSAKGTSSLIRRSLTYIESKKSKIIKFPSGQAIGALYLNRVPLQNYEVIITESNRNRCSIDEFVWERDAWEEACGDVSVPINKEINLTVYDEEYDDEGDVIENVIYRDDLLTALHAHDLSALEYSHLSEKNSVYLGRLIGLKWLVLSFCQLPGDSWVFLGKLMQLEVLVLSGVNIADNELRHLEELTNLSIIRLKDTKITGSGFKRLHALKNIKSVDFISSILDEAALHCLCGIESIVDLSIDSRGDDKYQVFNRGLQGIGNLKSLKYLSLRSKHMNDAGVAHLATLPQLTRLDISSFAIITDQALESIGHIKTLKNINLKFKAEFTDDGLMFLQELHELKSLSLGYSSNFTGSGIAHLTKLPNLVDLSLFGINDNAIKNIGNMSALKELYLHYPRVTSDGIKHLRNLDNLLRLGLREGPYSSARYTSIHRWIPYIGTLANLKELYLLDVSVTDDAIIHLSKLTNLRRLVINKSQLGQIAINQLSEALPNCEMSVYGP